MPIATPPRELQGKKSSKGHPLPRTSSPWQQHYDRDSRTDCRSLPFLGIRSTHLSLLQVLRIHQSLNVIEMLNIWGISLERSFQHWKTLCSVVKSNHSMRQVIVEEKLLNLSYPLLLRPITKLSPSANNEAVYAQTASHPIHAAHPQATTSAIAPSLRYKKELDPRSASSSSTQCIPLTPASLTPNLPTHYHRLPSRNEQNRRQPDRLLPKRQDHRLPRRRYAIISSHTCSAFDGWLYTQ